MIGKEAVHSRAATGGRDNWLSPDKIMDPLRKHFGEIGMDIATSEANPTRAAIIRTVKHSGLVGDWLLPHHTDTGWPRTTGAYNYGNCPYSMAAEFVLKAVQQALRGCEIIYLIASRTGSGWFRPCFDAQAIGWVGGRLCFPEASTGRPAPKRYPKKHPRAGEIEYDANGEEIPQTAPFDSTLVYWGHRPQLFCKAFNEVAVCRLQTAAPRPDQPTLLSVA